MAKNTIAGCYGMTIFSFVRNYQSVFKVTISFWIPNDNERDFLLFFNLSSNWYCQVLFVFCFLFFNF